MSRTRNVVLYVETLSYLRTLSSRSRTPSSLLRTKGEVEDEDLDIEDEVSMSS